MKKLLSFLLGIVIILSASACGTKATDNKLTNPPVLSYIYVDEDENSFIAEKLKAAAEKAGLNLAAEAKDKEESEESLKNGTYLLSCGKVYSDSDNPLEFLEMWTSQSEKNVAQLGKGANKDSAVYSLDLTPYGGENIENATWAETYDVLIGMIKSSTEKENKFALMHLAEDFLMKTGCIIPVYYDTDVYLISEKLNGVYSDSRGCKFFTKAVIKDSANPLKASVCTEPDTLDPALNTSVSAGSVISHLFSGLAKWEEDEEGNVKAVPDLAEELSEGTENQDGTVTYTYTLRKGVKWSNGDALKASDFEKAVKRAALAKASPDAEELFKDIKGYAEGTPEISADDNKGAITFILNKKTEDWNRRLANPAFFPVHPDTYEKQDWGKEAAGFISNGAYTLESWEHNSSITLKKNQNYINGDKVTAETISFCLSEDEKTVLEGFEKGEIQFVDEIDTSEIESLKIKYPNNIKSADRKGTYYICWNVNQNLLGSSALKGAEREAAQQEIRKAVGSLLDRNSIAEDSAVGGKIPASTLIPFGIEDADQTEFYKNANIGEGNCYTGYFDTAKETYNDNVKKAEAILKKYYKF